MKQRVAIIDDDAPARTALAEVLKTYGYAVAEYGSGQEFMASPEWDTYHCILLDIRMPGADGIEVQKRLRARDLRTPIIFITGHGDVPLAVRAMRGGAFDFVEKPVHDDELNAVIEAAVASVRQEAAEPDEEARYFERVGRLTPREREVMDLVVEGRSSAAIGAILGVSHRTVDHHRARILEKMEVASIAGLIRAVLRSRQ
ncbi:MAG: response regulator transcription factor [Rhizobiales bacterium]|nr:response regulator transcription factor [Hyphomicrobiales bacterium]